MKILGLEIYRRKAAPQALMSVNTWRNVLGYIRESFTGAWQQNVTIDRSPTTLLAFSAVYACVTGIASDIAKMRIKLDRNVDGIWEEIDALHGNNKWSWVTEVLRKPNSYQNRIQFITCWILSKLLYGNAYILKQRDSDGHVVAMFVLQPSCITPLVAEDGSVYYSLTEDYLSQIDEGKTVPASEIIHDRMPELWHPLVGVSPLFACAMSVTMGNKIQNDSTASFANSSRPGGVVTVPGEISDDIAERLKTAWETNYGGANSGRVAILGDGMKFDPVHVDALQSQLIEQLKWTVSDCARAFHYPEFKLGGALPPYAGNVEALIMSYYSDCLQSLIESMELCLDEGLGLPPDLGTELDTDSLMRMDTAALYDSNNKGVQGRWLAPNEARRKANLQPVEGGESPLAQHQDYSLAAIGRRNNMPNPFAPEAIPPPETPPVPQAPTKESRESDVMEKFVAMTVQEIETEADLELRKSLCLV